MARKTKCLTPGCMFHTRIHSKEISIRVTFPKEINFSKKEAILLEDLLHNSVEAVLRPYFGASRTSKRVMLKQTLKSLGGLYGKVRK